MRRCVVVTGLSLILVFAGCSSNGESGSATSSVARSTSPSSSAPTTTNAPAATPGCGKPGDAPSVTDKIPGDVEEPITIGSTERTYRLGVPDSYDPDEPTPLVMNLHGSGSNALQASVYSRVPQEANERGMLTITPEATNGNWQIGASGADHDFLMALVENIESRYCVDTNRVFVMGMSLGAWKAASTACAAPDTFAAAALVAVEVHPTDCPPIPVVAFHGTADATVPYGEGSGKEFPNSPNAGLPGTHENIANWAEGNKCDPRPETKKLGDDVERWTYAGCTADLVLYTVIGGGHTWPGASIDIGPTTQTIDATKISFDWFEAHPRTN